MIIVKLQGGLGNQMFQYALGRKLALELNTKLKFDASGFKNDFYRRVYKLDCFKLSAEIIKIEELNRILNYPDNFLTRFLSHFFKKELYSQIIEKEFNYNVSISQVLPNSYLSGYWQTEKYFIKYSKVLLNDFIFRVELAGQNKEYAKEIERTNSVSIHIRRLHGLSVTGEIDKNGIQLHGAASLEYYKTAISYLSEKIRTPHFYIFSDDSDYTIDNLKINYPTTFVTNNDDDHCQFDMQLMSLCKHNIIANSSFSWWGAWLNNNPEKIVIAPQKWFNEPGIDTSDLIPESWVRL